MRKSVWLTGLIIVLAFIVFFFVYSTGKFENSVEFRERYAVFSLNVPKSLDFAREAVPLSCYDVKEGLDRELHINTYWQSQTIFLIKRANRYFPEIEKILSEEGVPSDFKYLAVAESGLTNTISPSNAVGFWQFLKNTGKEYGLEINDEVDERYNLEKSTRAACKFLKNAYNEFGSWTMAAAAYNMGRPGIEKQIESQNAKNYYDLYLNEETARYIFRIISIKIILENPETYGFHIATSDLYPPLKYTQVTIDSAIPNLSEFAKLYKTNYKILRMFNPWIRDFSLTNKAKACYTFKIPTEGFRESLYFDMAQTADSIKTRN